MTQETLYVPFLKSPKLLAMQTVTICLIDKWACQRTKIDAFSRRLPPAPKKISRLLFPSTTCKALDVQGPSLHILRNGQPGGRRINSCSNVSRQFHHISILCYSFVTL